MPVVIWNSSPDWNAELYEKTVAKAWDGINVNNADELPEGFIAHLSLPRPGGGWQVFDVWDSQTAYGAFLDTRLMPAVASIDAPPFDTVVLEPHTIITRAGAA